MLPGSPRMDCFLDRHLEDASLQKAPMRTARPCSVYCATSQSPPAERRTLKQEETDGPIKWPFSPRAVQCSGHKAPDLRRSPESDRGWAAINWKLTRMTARGAYPVFQVGWPFRIPVAPITMNPLYERDRARCNIATLTGDRPRLAGGKNGELAAGMAEPNAERRPTAGQRVT